GVSAGRGRVRLPVRRRAALVGLLVGLSAAVKVVPVVAALPLARRHPWRVVVFAAATVLAVYAVPVALTGWDVVGYLPGYVHEQGYDNGDGFTIASILLPGKAAVVASVVALVVIAVLQWRHTDPDDPWTAQLVGAGAMLLVVSSPYPWYSLVLVPSIALTGRSEWFVVPLLMTVHLLVPDAMPMPAAVLGSVAVVTTAWRRRRSPRPARPVAMVLT
ncbi:MAG: conserved rane protein, partial [Humibacillus sp.]|nr:conserved rane protein [Humibacillus sp.]